MRVLSSLLLIYFCTVLRGVESKKCLFVDAIPPVFTPFDDDLKLNLSVVPIYARHLSKNGIYTVLVAGTVGEGMTLTLEERKLLLDAWVSAAKVEKLTVIMQVGGGLTVAEIHELASYSEAAGADAIMTLPEIYYSPTTVEQLVEFVKDIADHAKNTPIFYYDQPDFTGVELNMVEFFERASCEISTFVGLKCPAKTGITVLANVELKDYQSLIPYTDMGIVPTLAGQMNGTVTVAASICPDLVSAMVRDANNGDWESAIEKQEELNKRLAVITRDEGESTQAIAWLKTAMYLVNDINCGGVRKPIPETTPERQKEILEGLSGDNAYISIAITVG